MNGNTLTLSKKKIDNDIKEVVNMNEQIKETENTDKVSREAESRESFKRIPAGKPRVKLTVENLPKGYRYYYAHSRQFEELLSAGYVFVKKEQHKELQLGSLRERPNSLGNIVSREGSQNPNDRLYLMAIKEEWYRDNLREKAADIHKVEKQIRKGKFQAPEKSYLPSSTESDIT